MRVKNIENLRRGDLVKYQTARMAEEDGGCVESASANQVKITDGHVLNGTDYIDLCFRNCASCGVRFVPERENQACHDRSCAAKFGAGKRLEAPAIQKPRMTSRAAWELIRLILDCETQSPRAAVRKARHLCQGAEFPSVKAVSAALRRWPGSMGIDQAMFEDDDDQIVVNAIDLYKQKQNSKNDPPGAKCLLGFGDDLNTDDTCKKRLRNAIGLEEEIDEKWQACLSCHRAARLLPKLCQFPMNDGHICGREVTGHPLATTCTYHRPTQNKEANAVLTAVSTALKNANHPAVEKIRGYQSCDRRNVAGCMKAERAPLWKDGALLRESESQHVASEQDRESATRIDYGASVDLGITAEKFIGGDSGEAYEPLPRPMHDSLLAITANVLCSLLDEIRDAEHVNEKCAAVLSALGIDPEEVEI